MHHAILIIISKYRSLFILEFIVRDVKTRQLATGWHFVRDVGCKKCDQRLGWMYEFAKDEGEEYKEGQVVLELALILTCNGIEK